MNSECDVRTICDPSGVDNFNAAIPLMHPDSIASVVSAPNLSYIFLFSVRLFTKFDNSCRKPKMIIRHFLPIGRGFIHPRVDFWCSPCYCHL